MCSFACRFRLRDSCLPSANASGGDCHAVLCAWLPRDIVLRDSAGHRRVPVAVACAFASSSYPVVPRLFSLARAFAARLHLPRRLADGSPLIAQPFWVQRTFNGSWGRFLWIFLELGLLLCLLRPFSLSLSSFCPRKQAPVFHLVRLVVIAGDTLWRSLRVTCPGQRCSVPVTMPERILCPWHSTAIVIVGSIWSCTILSPLAFAPICGVGLSLGWLDCRGPL